MKLWPTATSTKRAHQLREASNFFSVRYLLCSKFQPQMLLEGKWINLENKENKSIGMISEP